MTPPEIQLDWTSCANTHTKIAKKLRGLRQIRDHRRKALVKTDPLVRSSKLHFHFVGYMRSSCWKIEKTCPNKPETPHRWIRPVKSTSTEVSYASGVPHLDGKYYLCKARWVLACSIHTRVHRCHAECQIQAHTSAYRRFSKHSFTRVGTNYIVLRTKYACDKFYARHRRAITRVAKNSL